MPKEVRGWALGATPRPGEGVVGGRGDWKRAAATKRAEAPQDSPPGLNDLRAEIRAPCNRASWQQGGDPGRRRDSPVASGGKGDRPARRTVWPHTAERDALVKKKYPKISL